MMLKIETTKIGIIGLGYVGLPLAIEFGRQYETIGFDISNTRIAELDEGLDKTLEVDYDDFIKAKKLIFTNYFKNLKDCNIYIVTVPTPIDENKNPDFSFIEEASRMVGEIINKGDIVIYESTVYPGATEELCVPLIEEISNFKYNLDFFCGYSPERINPGDKQRKLVDIIKITSGSNPEIAEKVDFLYNSIIIAGTHKAKSIKVAEAAKVIENTQRDLNIALINELSLIFNKLDINTYEVLEAAETKWNFLPFRPGLVGGHCIGVDPYYLTHKAIEIGYNPEIILAGRKLNDNMGYEVVESITKLMAEKKIKINQSKVLVMGFTFKENCPDIRNTRVIDIIEGFERLVNKVDVFDPWANKNDSKKFYNIDLISSTLPKNFYDAIVVAVAHNEFKDLGIKNIRKFASKISVIYDLKGIFDRDYIDGSL
jgi:UDP-N-acetyl-D-glucosamine/UDP-N-acetyl-D-galactosamine dehydrogenase